jgi:hypothetical protein
MGDGLTHLHVYDLGILEILGDCSWFELDEVRGGLQEFDQILCTEYVKIVLGLLNFLFFYSD